MLLDDVEIEISVQLGSTKMPIHQFLKLGRGAVVGLEASDGDDLLILADETPVAYGNVVIQDQVIGISVTRLVGKS